MQWRALALLVAVSGCLGPASNPQDSTSDPTRDGDDATNAAPRGGPDLGFPGASRVLNFSYDLARQAYQDSLKAYAIVADSPVHVAINWTIHLNQWGPEDSCAAGAVLSPSKTNPDPRANGAQFVAWAFRNDVRSSAHASGQDIELVPALFQGQTGGGMTANFTGGWDIGPGARVVVQLGGDDPEFARARHTSGGGSQANVFNISVTVSGQAHVEPLPDIPLRCGLGLYAMEGGTASVESVGSATLGGGVEIESPGGLTMIYLTAGNFLDPVQDGTLTFLNESVPVASQDFERTSLRAGGASIRMETRAEALPGNPAWFLAATAWAPSETMKER